MKKYDHFECHEWFGIFTTPDGEIEFPGHLTYSPEEGIQLDFMYSFSVKMPICKYLHGALSSGEVCTIFGDFEPAYFGMHLGKIAIRKSKVKFNSLVLGQYCDSTTRFDGYWADFTNFQEMCSPKDTRKSLAFSQEPVFSFESVEDGIKIDICHSGQFNFIPSRNIAAVLHCQNQNVIEELQRAFSSVMEKYPKEYLLSKEDLVWDFSFQKNDGMTMSDVWKSFSVCERFFTMLAFRPCRIKFLSLKVRSDIQEGKYERINVLTSMFDINSHKISFLKEDIDYFTLPMTLDKIDFSKAIAGWLKHYESFRTFHPRINNKFGRHEEIGVLGDIVFSLTQMEAIAVSSGKTKGKDKYDYPIRILDLTNISKVLRLLLKVKEGNTIGQALSNFRGEIAHVGRVSGQLQSMHPQVLVGISKCLDVLIATRLYQILEIDDKHIAHFQENQIRPWSSLLPREESAAILEVVDADSDVSANEPKAG